MLAAFAITFRETLEAVLIVGIILSLLRKIGRKELSKSVWIGTILATAGSLILALFFSLFLGGFEGRTEQIFEGIMMVFAAGVLTYMLFWMQFKRAAFEGKIEKAALKDSPFSLGLLAFTAVLREGIETVLFFFAASKTGTPFAIGAGGITGILVAVIIAFLIYKSTKKISLAPLFFWSGLVLFVIATGLFAHGVHEFQEAGLLPVFVEHLYDFNGVLNEKGFIGGILKAVFGYNGNPSLLEFFAYWGFILGVGVSVIKRKKQLQLA